MNYDYIYDKNSPYETEYKFNDKTELTVFFSNENIILKVDKDGNAIFTTAEGKEIKREKAESDRRFSLVYVNSYNGEISVNFPIIETVDHYPHCDGEYDRYSERIIDNIVFTLSV